MLLDSHQPHPSFIGEILLKMRILIPDRHCSGIHRVPVTSGEEPPTLGWAGMTVRRFQWRECASEPRKSFVVVQQRVPPTTLC